MIYPEFPNYSAFSIDNHPGSGYQAKITIAWKPGMRLDFRDIRFHDNLERKIPYWIESKTNGSTAVVWIKLTSSKIVTLRWGNPAARSESDGNAVFIFFDDFENGLAKWSVAGGTGTFIADSSNAYSGTYAGKYTHPATTSTAGRIVTLSQPITSGVLECNFKPGQLTKTLYPATLWDDGLSGVGTVLYFDTDHYVYGWYSPSTSYDPNFSYSVQYYKIVLKLKSATAYDVIINGSQIGTNWHPDGDHTSFDTIGFGGESASGIEYLDNIFLRKYAATEPTFTYITSGYIPQTEWFSPFLERTLLNKEFTSSNDLLLSKQFITSNDLLISKIFSQSNKIVIEKLYVSTSDIHLQHIISSTNDIQLEKSFSSASRIQIGKVFTQHNKILVYKEFTNENDIITRIFKEYFSFSDILIQKSFYSGSDIDVRRTFSQHNKILLSKGYASENDILTSISKGFSSTSDIKVLKIFSQHNKIRLRKEFISESDILASISKEFSSDSDIHLLKPFFSGSDIQVGKLFSQNNRILIKKEFSSENGIIFSLLRIFTSTSDIHLLKSFYSGSDIRIQKHFYSGSDIQVGKAFSSESDILILLSKAFSSTSNIQVLRVFAGSSDINLSKIFSSSNDIILIAESGEFDHPLTVIILQVDRGIIISQVNRTVNISQITRTVTILQ